MDKCEKYAGILRSVLAASTHQQSIKFIKKKRASANLESCVSGGQLRQFLLYLSIPKNVNTTFWSNC